MPPASFGKWTSGFKIKSEILFGNEAWSCILSLLQRSKVGGKSGLGSCLDTELIVGVGDLLCLSSLHLHGAFSGEMIGALLSQWQVWVQANPLLFFGETCKKRQGFHNAPLLELPTNPPWRQEGEPGWRHQQSLPTWTGMWGHRGKVSEWDGSSGCGKWGIAPHTDHKPVSG